MSMWAYVHTFPESYRPKPRAVLVPGAVVRVEKTPGGDEAISRVIVEKGTVQTTNIPIHEDGKPAGMGASMTIARETTLPPRVEQQRSSAVFGLLAPDVVLAGSNQPDKFGVEGVPVLLLPGVKAAAASGPSSRRQTGRRPCSPGKQWELQGVDRANQSTAGNRQPETTSSFRSF